MANYYIQRLDNPSVNIYDRFKIKVLGVESLPDFEEAQQGKNTVRYNFIIRVSVSTNQMNLLNQLTDFIGRKEKGQFDKAFRGEPKDGVFQFVDQENHKGYRLTYISLEDTKLKDGKNKILEIACLNEVPQSSLVTDELIQLGNSACDIYFSDGGIIRNISKKVIDNIADWAIVIPVDGTPFTNGSPVYSGAGYVSKSQVLAKSKKGGVYIACDVQGVNQIHPVASYNKGESFWMLEPLFIPFTTKHNINKQIGDKSISYFSKLLLPDIALPEGFEIPTLKDVMELNDILTSEDLMDQFFHKDGLYGFLEYLALDTKTPRAAFWCYDNQNKPCGFQFIKKGYMIVCERIHVEDYTYLPILGIYRNE